VRELATRGADLDAADPEHGGTAFHLACGLNQPECAAVLVELGCDTAIMTKNGRTGKQIAEEWGHAAVLERLAKAMERRRALWATAERAGSQYTRQFDDSWAGAIDEVIDEVMAATKWVKKLLLDTSFFIHFPGKSWAGSKAAATEWMEGGWRNSTLATHPREHLATVLTAAIVWSAVALARGLARSLRRCGARLGCRRWLARTWQGSALYVATQAGDLAKMGQLLDGGAEPDTFIVARYQDGNIFQDTALGEAAGAGDLEAVRLLLGRGADPSLANSDGGTALMRAVENGHARVVRELAARGADLDTVHPVTGATAFHIACGHNEPECAAALVELGCDTAIKTKNGRTGKQIAEQMGHAAALERLAAVAVRQGLYPMVTSQCSSATLYQVSDHTR
jgi:ankyrin repeat protein